MKNYKIFIVALSGLLISTLNISCEKMIEVETPSNLLDSEQVFESVQTANAALSGLYADLWDNSPLAGDKSGLILGLYTDDLSYYSQSSNNGLMEYYQNTVIDSNPLVSAYWTNAYQKVYMANAIIEGVEASNTIKGDERSRILAEALLIRSVLFFYLQQIYGDIPYPVTTNYQINQTISKTSSVEVLERIESDLKDAITGLKDAYRNTERIFPNKKAAQLMLAKTLITEKKYGEAEQILKEIIQSPLYAIQNDITKVFDKSGTHILWQLKPRNTGGSTKEIQSYYFTASAPVNIALSQDLISSFSTGDLRRENWISSLSVGTNTWYRANKYKVLTNNTTEYSIVFRIEEAYLLLSESLAQQGKTQEAVLHLNKIRQRSNLPALSNSISQQVLMDELVKENRSEFFTEMGNRFFVLKRFGKLDNLITVKPNWKTYFQNWPLPQKELLLNPNVNPQNPGY
ncbi:RagB/SusD family nutrient uptake outer membrane protein [Chryseobacterium sp. G0201]|uniref:RagB/SusD family nutrient uptake outer membrane protein n=1 Tax=Chryseobacterium sp. G0201 TaxID=2487065 RepID=UPI000F50B7CB|nr:RagB/SusD family nutrient uptake outer membrane protein [Chryseobacterium sp. G0201]AZA54059.1 RagB/SusD family nutrient uptake outer membrane protein [Chryseobacterium sp. G0201]